MRDRRLIVRTAARRSRGPGDSALSTRVLWLGGALLFEACGDPLASYTDESSSSATTSTTTEADTTAAPPECTPAQSCVELPTGWGGVVLMGDPDQCDGRLSYADFATGPDTRCTCVCNPESPCTVTVQTFADAQCSTEPLEEFEAEPLSCIPVPDVPDGGRVGAVATTDPSAACEPIDSALLGEPTNSILRACEADNEYATCGDRGRCLGEADPACIWTHGDEACPEPFTERQLRYSSFTDMRRCEGCSCGPLEPAQCDGQGFVFFGASEADCKGGPAPLACAALPFGPPEFMYFEVDFGGCEPASTSEFLGEVVPADPLTYCCLPT